MALTLISFYGGDKKSMKMANHEHDHSALFIQTVGFRYYNHENTALKLIYCEME